MNKEAKVIVIGGGHAGYEAALASARLGVKTIMITIDKSQIGRLPCNPAVGGIAKSHLVSEIDALGGEIGRNADFTGIQYRMLNTRKGPAVQSNRIQCDKDIYPIRIQHILKKQKNLEIIEDMVNEIKTHKGKVNYVVTRSNGIIYTNNIVICTGTFLKGRVLIGNKSIPQGRIGEESAEKLSKSFEEFGFNLERLKTGTPPRIHKDSVNYNVMEEQPGENPPPLFSRYAKHIRDNKIKDIMFHVEHSELIPWIPGNNQVSCYLTHTNKNTHQIIHDNLNKSSMYSGLIEGTGVRYCPSIEDKIVKFAGRDSHHVFIEPEGRKSIRLYPNGISNSLPEEIQQRMVRSIKGMEKAELIRPGYAIEYDFSDPTQLFHTLETKKVEGLFFAGQINGTTGYEEASAQGFIAGVNAAFKSLGEKQIILERNESYIGVLIDDLVTKGTDEPYRMFTSRSEYRLTLRQDNAEYRLHEKVKQIGIHNKDHLNNIENEIQNINKEIIRLEKTFSKGKSLGQILRRPDKNYFDVVDNSKLNEKEINQVQTEIKYKGYIKREKDRIEIAKRQESWKIPYDFNYYEIKSLRAEAREKLIKIKPENLGQAGRISGVNPSDIAILSLMIKKKDSINICQ